MEEDDEEEEIRCRIPRTRKDGDGKEKKEAGRRGVAIAVRASRESELKVQRTEHSGREQGGMGGKRRKKGNVMGHLKRGWDWVGSKRRESGRNEVNMGAPQEDF